MPTPNKIETHGDNHPQFHHSPVSGNVRIQYILQLTQKHSTWLIISATMITLSLLVVIAMFTQQTQQQIALFNFNKVQVSNGFCSPIVNNTQGNVTITCTTGVKPEEYVRIKNLFEKNKHQLISTEKSLEEKTQQAQHWLASYQKTSETLEQLKTEDRRIYDLAKQAFDQGELDKVIQIGEDYIAKGKSTEQRNAKVAYLVGLSYGLKFQYQPAFNKFLYATRQDPEQVDYYIEASKYGLDLAEYKRVIYFADEALRIIESEEPIDIAMQSNMWNNLGVVWNAKGDYDKAINYFEKTLVSTLKTFDSDHPNVATTWNNLGEAWRAKGDYEQAIAYYEKALVSDLKTFGPEHPRVVRSWYNLGSAWRAKGEYGQAIAYYEKSLVSDLKTFGPDHPSVATSWNDLGLAWQAKGGYDQAMAYYEKALASNLKFLGPDHPNVATTWNNLGGAWHAKGNSDQAIDYTSKALAVFIKVLGEQHPHTLLVKDNIAFFKREQERAFADADL